MKATLIFDLDIPEDREAHERCVKAQDLCFLLNDISNLFRKIRKYEDLTDEQEVLFSRLDNEYITLIKSHDIDLNKLIS